VHRHDRRRRQCKPAGNDFLIQGADLIGRAAAETLAGDGGIEAVRTPRQLEGQNLNTPIAAAADVPASVPALGRSLQSRHISMIAIGGIIGAGLFVGSGAAIAEIGPAVVISYALAGLVVLMVMRMLSEMATENPGVGAFTEFPRLALGNWAGFVAGWLYWYFWVVVVAIEVIAGAVIIAAWVPLPVWQIGLGLLVLMSLINLMSTRSYGEFEFWFSTIKVAAIIAFILIAGSFVFGFTGSGSGGLENLVSHGGFAPKGALAVAAGVTTVIFSLCGAEIATIAAAESAEPARVVARLTGSVALRILLFYIASIFLITAVVPWDTIVPGASPFATALESIGIPGAATIMNIVVLVAVLSCLNSALYVTSRVLFTLASKGDAPEALIKLNKAKVPARAILAGSLFGYAAVIASVVSPERVFSFLVNASGATILMIYLLVAVAQFVLRRQSEARGIHPVLPMWLHPWGSILTMAGMVSVLVAMAITPALTSQFWASMAAAGIAIVAFILRNRRRA
jgi:L-asparagine transporter-like permease